jgi:hypothetical protein
MSRGLGWQQRFLLDLLMRELRPITFEEIRKLIDPTGRADAAMIRSLRRALHSLDRDKTIMVSGRGGRGDPFRYYSDPLGVAIACNKEQFDMLMANIEAAGITPSTAFMPRSDRLVAAGDGG